MREIKFRAWDKCEKSFIYFDALDGILSQCDETYRKRCVGIFEQFTGLHDIENNAGYHNDLFADSKGVIYLVDKDFVGWLFINGDVGYRADAFFTNVPGQLDGFFIGNIHENPELLS